MSFHLPVCGEELVLAVASSKCELSVRVVSAGVTAYLPSFVISPEYNSG